MQTTLPSRFPVERKNRIVFWVKAPLWGQRETVKRTSSGVFNHRKAGMCPQRLSESSTASSSSSTHTSCLPERLCSHTSCRAVPAKNTKQQCEICVLWCVCVCVWVRSRVIDRCSLRWDEEKKTDVVCVNLFNMTPGVKINLGWGVQC